MEVHHLFGGGITALLVMAVYTLVTGKLTLTKTRVVYGMPARATALLGLVPLMLVCAYSVRLGGIANLSYGLPLFFGALAASVAVIYAVGWMFGESPRA